MHLIYAPLLFLAVSNFCFAMNVLPAVIRYKPCNIGEPTEWNCGLSYKTNSYKRGAANSAETLVAAMINFKRYPTDSFKLKTGHAVGYELVGGLYRVVFYPLFFTGPGGQNQGTNDLLDSLKSNDFICSTKANRISCTSIKRYNPDDKFHPGFYDARYQSTGGLSYNVLFNEREFDVNSIAGPKRNDFAGILEESYQEPNFISLTHCSSAAYSMFNSSTKFIDERILILLNTKTNDTQEFISLIQQMLWVRSNGNHYFVDDGRRYDMELRQRNQWFLSHADGTIQVIQLTADATLNYYHRTELQGTKFRHQFSLWLTSMQTDSVDDVHAKLAIDRDWAGPIKYRTSMKLPLGTILVRSLSRPHCAIHTASTEQFSYIPSLNLNRKPEVLEQISLANERLQTSKFAQRSVYPQSMRSS